MYESSLNEVRLLRQSCIKFLYILHSISFIDTYVFNIYILRFKINLYSMTRRE